MSDIKIRMHRIVMDLYDNNLVIDHINHNRSDNKKENLRVCTQQENAFNKKKDKIIGVYYDNREKSKSNKHWYSQLKYNGKIKCLGTFLNKEDAIIARLQAELKYFGEFAPQRHLFEKYKIK